MAAFTPVVVPTFVVPTFVVPTPVVVPEETVEIITANLANATRANDYLKFKHRCERMKQLLLNSGAGIICVQEARLADE